MNRDELLRLYEMAVREYHLNTTLGTQRQAFYLALNVSLIGALASWGRSGILPALAFLAGAITSALGAHTVRQTHRYYQASRAHFQELETRLQLDSELRLGSTPGQRGDTGRMRLKVSTAAALALLTLGLLDLICAALALR